MVPARLLHKLTCPLPFLKILKNNNQHFRISLDGVNVFLKDDKSHHVDVFLQTLDKLRKKSLDNKYVYTMSVPCNAPEAYFGEAKNKLSLEKSVPIVKQVLWLFLYFIITISLFLLLMFSLAKSFVQFLGANKLTWFEFFLFLAELFFKIE